MEFEGQCRQRVQFDLQGGGYWCLLLSDIGVEKILSFSVRKDQINIIVLCLAERKNGEELAFTTLFNLVLFYPV